MTSSCDRHQDCNVQVQVDQHEDIMLEASRPLWWQWTCEDMLKRLLTVRPGSVHGGGEAPEGQSSLRQGAGKGSPKAPYLGSVALEGHKEDSDWMIPSLKIADGPDLSYTRTDPEEDYEEFYSPPTTHLVATVEDLTDMLDYPCEDVE
ncbi:hypothetical protein ZWY2020_014712, partial [Hordeum vulgare]